MGALCRRDVFFTALQFDSLDKVCFGTYKQARYSPENNGVTGFVTFGVQEVSKLSYGWVRSQRILNQNIDCLP